MSQDSILPTSLTLKRVMNSIFFLHYIFSNKINCTPLLEYSNIRIPKFQSKQNETYFFLLFINYYFTLLLATKTELVLLYFL